ncbi:MAG: hypothetical protein Q4C13_01555, partial [Clostridia bacterium]|nr:hypothetical protein [Clostridia bacterium]
LAAQAELELIPPEKLIEAAERQGLRPDMDAVFAHILREEAQRKQRKSRLGGLSFRPGAAKKYLVTALLLFALSFLSRYALYYRMLAALCMSVFSINLFFDRTRGARPGIE